ncbi:MarR family winged helix-turn-helix transcriptional regulator [Halobacteriovorax marinus]|uniref:MarR family winged helix-turn-helix transcriptional regulator n=1 Tax=Halobacteriovorax marinus TaxID=97084 RepID=UPI003A92972B
MNYDNLKLKNQICHRLYIASNAMTRVYRPMLAELDLTYPQYVVLMALWEKDSIPIQELIEMTGIDAGSLSLMLTKLEKKKIIKIHKDKEDKRKRIINLSEKGLSLKDKALSVPQKMWSCLESLDYENGLKLIELLDKMNCDLAKSE